jgi:hypothetical protein
MKYWKARHGGWNKPLEEIEVEKATESMVWINGRRNAKFSNYDNYFPTREKAIEWLIRQADDDANTASRELDIAKRQLKEYIELSGSVAQRNI